MFQTTVRQNRWEIDIDEVCENFIGILNRTAMIKNDLDTAWTKCETDKQNIIERASRDVGYYRDYLLDYHRYNAELLIHIETISRSHNHVLSEFQKLMEERKQYFEVIELLNTEIEQLKKGVVIDGNE